MYLKEIMISLLQPVSHPPISEKYVFQIKPSQALSKDILFHTGTPCQGGSIFSYWAGKPDAPPRHGSCVWACISCSSCVLEMLTPLWSICVMLDAKSCFGRIKMPTGSNGTTMVTNGKTVATRGAKKCSQPRFCRKTRSLWVRGSPERDMLSLRTLGLGLDRFGAFFRRRFSKVGNPRK